MKPAQYFLGFIICILLASVGYTHEATIAILDFENNSLFKKDDYNSLSKGLAEMMITELSQVESMDVVERQKLRALLDELKLSQSGLMDEDHSLQVGQMLGAEHLLLGGFMVAMKEKIRIDLRIVEVQTGLTIKAEEVTGKAKDILSLIKKLSKKLVKDLNIKMTKNEEKALSKSKKLDMEAVLFFSKGLEAEDNHNLKQASEMYQKALKIEPDFDQAKIRLESVSSELVSKSSE